jgi:iron transport multicopper oxidase
MIQVNQNDTVRVHATNGLGDQPTALHTHGVHFNNTGYYDGPIGTTQCGIPPGETLVYEIPVELQYGTYWIHVSRHGPLTLVTLKLLTAGPQTRPIRRRSASSQVPPGARPLCSLTPSFTAFVITAGEKRTDVTWDDEFTVIVGDWYHQENSWLVQNEFLTWVSRPSVPN